MSIITLWNWIDRWYMCLVTQSCPTICDSLDWNLVGSSVHGILQARILEWFAFHSPWWYIDRYIDRSIDFSGCNTTSWGSWWLGQAISCLFFTLLHGSISYILIYASVLDQELWRGPFLSNPESPLVEEESNMQHHRMLWRDRMTHMLPLKGTDTQSAFYRHWPVTGRSKACLLGPRGRVVLSGGSKVYFSKLPSPPQSPTSRFSSSLRASLKVTLNSSTLTSHIQSHSKRIQSPGPLWPPMSSPSTESTHSHTRIPPITSLSSELQTHTPISSSPSTFHLSNSHFRICFLSPILPWCLHLQGKLQTLLSEFSPVHGPPELTPHPQPQLSPFLPSKWYWCNYTTHTHRKWAI